MSFKRPTNDACDGWIKLFTLNKREFNAVMEEISMTFAMLERLNEKEAKNGLQQNGDSSGKAV